MSEPASPKEFASELWNLDLHEHCADLDAWRAAAEKLIAERDRSMLNGSGDAAMWRHMILADALAETPETIEAMAKAIAEAGGNDFDEVPNLFLRRARSALAAIRTEKIGMS